MSNPTRKIVKYLDEDTVLIEECFDLTVDCPLIVFDLQTMLKRLDVQSVVRRFPMRRRQAVEYGISNGITQ